MIDRQFTPLRMGACARRNRARLARRQGQPALPPIGSATLLGADPPHNDANYRSTI